MSRTIIAEVEAEYDAERHALILPEPLADIKNHEKLQVAVTKSINGNRSWLEFEGMLSREEGEALTASVEELFGPQG